MKKIGVIGSGSWGTAIATVLSNNNHQVKLWSYLLEEYEMLEKNREHVKFLPGVKLDDNISFTTSMEEAVSGMDVIVIACPSFEVRSTCERVKEFYKDQIVVSIAKGLEDKSLKCLSEVIEEVINPVSKVCVLSGPSHAEEVGKKMCTTLVAASEDIKIAERFRISLCVTI